MPLLDTLADALRLRRLVLALDNCEHLLDACARLSQRLLASSAELRLLATSREPLRVAGETVWLVPPLPVTATGTSPGDAVQLFAERALAAAPGFALTPENAGAVAELCRSLDGIPLAIELAAARLRTLTVDQIRMRVADRFGLLTLGDRTAPPRQRTLRAAIDWSHDLLIAAGAGAAATAVCTSPAGRSRWRSRSARTSRCRPEASWTRWARCWTSRW